MDQPAPYQNQVIFDSRPIAWYRESLLILVGPSGSGKSTFAQQHFLPTMTVATDQCRALIADTPANQKVSQDAFSLFYTIIGARLAHGYPTVADSTALRRKYRQKLAAIADVHNFRKILILFDLPDEFCKDNDLKRRYTVGPGVIGNQFQLLRKTLAELYEEVYDQVLVFTSAEQIANFRYRWTHPLVERDFPGPLDIIGDVHGCHHELTELLNRLEYVADEHGFSHHQARRVLFLGDILDRGPGNIEVFNLVYRMWWAQRAYYVPGNHCNKLFRYLKGNDVQVGDGLEKTIAELDSLDERKRENFIAKFGELYNQAPPYLIFARGRLLAVHGGILHKFIGRVDKHVWRCCMYGPGAHINQGKVIRPDDWVDNHPGTPMIVYGHTPVAQARWRNNTINIDLGAVFGGRLAALRYPENEIVSVPSQQPQL